MAKVSIYTIAQQVGVSAATVSRALSGKSGVRPELRQRILDVANELDYQPNLLARRLSSSEITIAVFFSNMQFEEFGEDLFLGAYDACAELADYNVKIRMCRFSDVSTPRAVDQVIEILRSGVQGVISLPRTDDDALDARIQEAVRDCGIAVAQTTYPSAAQTDIFSCQFDIYTAGAMAAELLWNLLGDNAKVSIFTSQKDNLFNTIGIQGFQDAMKSYPLKLCAVYENYDDRQMAYHATGALLRNHPDVHGIYVNSANSRMVCQRLSETEHPERFCLITSDLYPELVHYIERRMVRATIIQEQYAQGYESFRVLANYLITHIPPESPVRIFRPQIVLRSNMEQFLNPRAEEKSPGFYEAIERYEF